MECDKQYGNRQIETITAEELLKMEFPEPKFSVKNLIQEGATLFAGTPKRGKSWFALQLAVAVSQGKFFLGNIPTKKLGVLYLALEDHKRRLKDRLQTLNKLGEIQDQANLIFSTEISRASDGGLDMIDKFIQTHTEFGLVIIDTLAKFRMPSRGKASYQDDYRTIDQLKEIAL